MHILELICLEGMFGTFLSYGLSVQQDFFFKSSLINFLLFKVSIWFYICLKPSPDKNTEAMSYIVKLLKSGNHFHLFTGEDLKTNS